MCGFLFAPFFTLKIYVFFVVCRPTTCVNLLVGSIRIFCATIARYLVFDFILCFVVHIFLKCFRHMSDICW